MTETPELKKSEGTLSESLGCNKLVITGPDSRVYRNNLAFVETVLEWEAGNEKPPTIINQNLSVKKKRKRKKFICQETNVGSGERGLNGLKIACR